MTHCRTTNTTGRQRRRTSEVFRCLFHTRLRVRVRYHYERPVNRCLALSSTDFVPDFGPEQTHGAPGFFTFSGGRLLMRNTRAYFSTFPGAINTNRAGGTRGVHYEIDPYESRCYYTRVTFTAEHVLDAVQFVREQTFAKARCSTQSILLFRHERQDAFRRHDFS